MSNNKNVQFAAGWLKTSKKDGSQYISGSANGKLQKVKLLLQDESGNVTPVDKFSVFFNTEKPSENAPDVRFVLFNND